MISPIWEDRIVKFVETERRIGHTGAGEWDNEELLFNGHSLNLGGWKVLGMDGDDICITMWTYLNPVNCVPTSS